MHPDTRNPFENRPSGNPDTAKFLAALGDSQAAKVYREAMGEESSPSTPDDQGQELTPEELARLQALEDRERAFELVELRKREYFVWAQEFDLGDDDPQEWIDETFTFNPDGTVEVSGDLHLFNKELTRLPKGLTRVNGDLDLSGNQLTFLEGLPSEIHGDLHLSRNRLITLGDLEGMQVDGNLFLFNVPATDIPDGIELGGGIIVDREDTVLAANAREKGYAVAVW